MLNITDSSVENMPSNIADASLAILFFFVIWRFYMFTLRPRLQPLEPIILPYSIPYVGHLFSFFQSSNKLVEQGIKYTNSTSEPFGVQLLGTQWYIITHPEDVAAVFKNTQTLSYDHHLTQLLIRFGVTKAGMAKVWHKPQPGDWCYIPNNPANPKQLDLIHFGEDLYKRQLLSTEPRKALSKRFVDSILASLTWTQLDVCTRFDLPASETGDGGPLSLNQPFRHVSLRLLCQFFVVEGIIRSLFGTRMHRIEPNIVNIIREFNEHVWMLVFGYTFPCNSPTRKSQKQLRAALKKLILLPEDERQDMSGLITTMLEECDTVDVDIESRVSMLMVATWSAVSNGYHAVFWMLSYTLYDQILFNSIKQETETAWHSDELDMDHLLANSPISIATFHETLRVRSGTTTVRKVAEEIIVGGKLLRAGNTIMIPAQQLHKNSQVWGSEVDQFDHQKFLVDKGLAEHPAYRPFGGGPPHCPGRTLAKENMLGLIAVLVHRFDFQLAYFGGKRPPFPKMNTSTPSLGIIGPAKGQDLILKIGPMKY